MSIADLMEAMAKAGAPMEAILLAVRAVEAKDAEIAARRANDRDRKRRQRGTVTGQSRDSHVDVPEPLILEVSPHTPLPNPDLDIPPYNPPNSIEPETPALRPEHVIEYWNDRAAVVGLPKATLTPKRRRGLTTRIRVHPVEHWTEAIDAIERSSFLLGDNDRGWRATFDFLLRPDSIAKLREGTYDRSAN